MSIMPEKGPGGYRDEKNAGPGRGGKSQNHPAYPAFRESVKVGGQNLYARAKELAAASAARELAT